MDTFQSANMAQDLASHGFVVEPNFSVDRVQKDPGNGKPVCLPYHYFKTAIYEKRIKIYKKCDQLTDEIISLERKGDGHIDHPQNGSKDQADAVCGATYLASKYACEYSYNYGDNLNAAIEANDGANGLLMYYLNTKLAYALQYQFLGANPATYGLSTAMQKRYKAYNAPGNNMNIHARDFNGNLYIKVDAEGNPVPDSEH